MTGYPPMTDQPGRQFERLFQAAGAFLSARDPETDETEILRQHEAVRDLLAPMLGLDPDNGDGERADDEHGDAALESMDGQRNGRRYEILEELGHGGVGVVYRARDHDLGREVALKTLRTKHDTRLDVLRRFEEEARISGQLQHPGIVPVYELGLRADARPFFAMKLVRGETLAVLFATRKDLLDRRQHLLTIFEQVCQTMAYAHSRSVVHRDLKPGNIMVGAFGEVQVVDWGFARVLREEPTEKAAGTSDAATPTIDAESTEALDTSHEGDERTSLWGTVIGTPAYMPPEQAAGDLDRMNERSDVCALGAILFEILTGRPPYGGDDDARSDLIAEARACELSGAFQRLDERCSERDLADLTKLCLSAAPEARPSDAAVLADRIRQHLASVAERARLAELHASRAELRAEQERRTRKLTLTLAGSVLLTIVTVAAGWLWWDRAEQARLRDLAAEVEAMMQDAVRLQGDAVGQPSAPADAALERAALTANAAHALAASAAPGSELARRAFELREAIGTQQAATRERLSLLELQDSLRAAVTEGLALRADDMSDRMSGSWAHQWIRRLGRMYPAAFRDHGIDLEALPVEAIVTRLAGKDGAEFAAVLDQLALAWRAEDRQRLGNERKRERSSRLLAIAHQLDPHDELRSRLRELLDEQELGFDTPQGVQNVDRAVELAQRLDTEKASPASVMVAGLVLLGAKRSSEATRLFERSHRHHPNDFALNFWLGIQAQYAKPPRFVDAQRYFTAALALAPHSAGVMDSLGYNFQATGDFESARPWMSRAIELSPNSALLHYNLGVVSGHLGDRAGSVAALVRANDLSPDNVNYLVALGAALVGNEEFDLAIGAFHRALALDDQHASAHTNLGVALARKGLFLDAIREHETAMRLAPAHTQARINLGVNLLRQGDADVQDGRLDDAMRRYERCLEIGKGLGPAHAGIANVHRARGDLAAAAEAYRRAIAAEPDWLEPHLEMAKLCQDLKDHDEARKWFDAAVTLEPDNATAHFTKGVWHKTRGEFGPARACLEEAIRLRDDYASALASLAECDLHDGALDTAEEHARRGLASDPDNVPALRVLAAVHLKRNKTQDAKECLLRVIDLQPQNSGVRRGLAHLFRADKDFRRAAEQFRELVRRDDKDADTHVLLGLMLFQQGMVDESIACFRTALDHDPNCAHAWCQLGNAMAEAGDYDASLRHLRRGHELGTKRPDWKFDSAAWVASAETRLQAEGRLLRIVDGEAAAANAAETAHAAAAALRADRARDALRLFDNAFAADPVVADDVSQRHRYHAARAALRVAAGPPEGPPEESTTAPPEELRAKALAWLQADLGHWRRERASGKHDEVRQACQRWLHERDLAGVRDAASPLLGLGEREAWQQLWRDVEGIASLD